MVRTRRGGFSAKFDTLFRISRACRCVLSRQGGPDGSCRGRRRGAGTIEMAGCDLEENKWQKADPQPFPLGRCGAVNYKANRVYLISVKGKWRAELDLSG
mgnify:CR=1 FL=1